MWRSVQIKADGWGEKSFQEISNTLLNHLQIIFTWRNDGEGILLMLKHLISPFTSPVTMFYKKIIKKINLH